MSDTSSSASDEAVRSSLAKTLENNIGPYLKTVKNLIVDTKLANDPSQDNFIKCRNTPMFVVNIIFGHYNVRPDRDGAHVSPDRKRI